VVWMNKFEVGRYVTDAVLGMFWAYRANIFVERGFTYREYFISFLIVILLLYILCFFISKQYKTALLNKIKKEAWKDVVSILIGIGVVFIFEPIIKSIWK